MTELPGNAPYSRVWVVLSGILISSWPVSMSLPLERENLKRRSFHCNERANMRGTDGSERIREL